MASRNNPLRIQKRLLQYNDLPFAFGEIDEISYTSVFKGDTQSYTNNAHGGYYPTLGEFGKLETSEFTATVSIDFKDINCDDKIRYARFVKRQLARSGRLWATQNGTELIWAYARVTSINEVVSNQEERNMLHLMLSFELIDGYWRIASRTRTFLCDYCPARFQDFDSDYCWDSSDLEGICDETGSSKCIPCELNLYEKPKYEGCHWKPLCYFPHLGSRTLKNGEYVPSLQEMFGQSCANQWAIRYSCELESDFFCYDASWGRKFRLRADNNINTTSDINFCSKTDLPTDFVRVRLVGEFINPTIKFNDDVVSIQTGAPIDGMLTIGFGPKVVRSNSRKDPKYQAITLTDGVTRTNTPAFQVQPGNNHIEVTGNTYRQDSFIYIESIDITY